jgi:hypothetical protein
MNKPVTPKDVELFCRVDEVVHYVWDPIGVAEEPWARDEYNSYLSQIFEMTRDTVDVNYLSAFLNKVATERMGLNPNEQHCLKVAELLREWKNRLDKKYPAGQ